MSVCECGCGKTTAIAPCSSIEKGWVKGKPLRFLKGHNLSDGNRKQKVLGRKSPSSHGYMRVMTETGREYEHIVIAQRVLGRKLRNFGKGHADTEVVHHVNGDKLDNRFENLLICTHSYHTMLHYRLERSMAWPEFQKRIGRHYDHD